MKRQLTDTSVRSAKLTADGKPRKVADGGGRYLFVGKTGKSWRYDYQFGGKRNFARPAGW